MIPKNRCPTHPGVILLKHFLQPLKISQAEFVRHVGAPWTTTRLNEIIRGKRGISLETALDLADALGTSAEFWLNLQMNHDLWKAKRTHHKIKKINFKKIEDDIDTDCQQAIGL
jgi:antitoxin HigA-1